MIKHKKALLLDMNSTFMFGEDRFGEDRFGEDRFGEERFGDDSFGEDSFGKVQDFSVYYHAVGGELSASVINEVIRKVYDDLSELYPDETYRHCFPTVDDTIRKVCDEELAQSGFQKIVDTFAFHERGYIPVEYANALHELSRYFTLSVVIDIWAPKQSWLKVFDDTGVSGLFSAASFSSDHGMVKPSPKPFERVVKQLGVDKSEALVVGDSVRRDLGGAIAAGIDCVLVGGASDPAASGSFSDLPEFTGYCRQALALRDPGQVS